MQQENIATNQSSTAMAPQQQRCCPRHSVRSFSSSARSKRRFFYRRPRWLVHKLIWAPYTEGSASGGASIVQFMRKQTMATRCDQHGGELHSGRGKESLFADLDLGKHRQPLNKSTNQLCMRSVDLVLLFFLDFLLVIDLQGGHGLAWSAE